MALVLDSALTRFSDDAGGDRPNPLVRNSNTTGTYDETKAGPRGVVKKAAPGTTEAFIMLWEAINDKTASALATSPDVEDWTKDDANNPVMSPTTTTWENGEAAASGLVWDPAVNKYRLYYHGGGTGSTRQIGWAQADKTDLTTWTKSTDNPVLGPSSSGWDSGWVADPSVIRRSSNDWLMYFRGQNTIDNSGTIQIGLATSTDGKTWTKSTDNPVLTPGTGGTWEETHTYGPGAFLDPDGSRIHLWYVGEDSTGAQALGYAFSDDDTTFTKSTNNPVLTNNSTELDSPDSDTAGDTLEAVHDGDKVIVMYGGFELSGNYTGTGGSSCRSICGSWVPLEQSTTPATPGRYFGSSEWVSVGTSLSVLDDAQYTLAARIRAPSRESGTWREIYTEDGNDFNDQVFMRLDGSTSSAGRLKFFHRTPNALLSITTTGRFDDNLWHNVGFRRNSSSDFDIVVDGAAKASSTGTNPGTISSTNNTGTGIGNWDGESVGSEPFLGTIGRIALWDNSALATTDIDAFLDNGTIPSTGEPLWWYDLGSGSPEPDQSSSTNDGTVTGTVVVDASSGAGVTDTSITVSNDRLADMAFCRGSRSFGPGHLPIPDSTLS